MEIRFEVIGHPVGKQETKFNFKTRHAYKPEESRRYKELVSWTAKKYMKESKKEMLFGPVRMDLIITLKKVKPAYDKHKFFVSHHLSEDYPCKKPDRSNVLKTVEDALEGICYDNDMNIVDGYTKKVYGEPEKVEIIINPVN
jgi:Holliday junction resolvase RusA-like endonuclease